MYTLFFAGVRKPELSTDEFREYWLTTHAGIVREVPGLVRYVITFVPERARTDSFPFDGYAVVTYSSRDALVAASTTEIAARIAADEHELFDVDRCVRTRVDEHVIDLHRDVSLRPCPVVRNNLRFAMVRSGSWSAHPPTTTR